MTAVERVATVRALWPLLVVNSLESSVRFYRDRLGFSLVSQAESEGRMFWCRLEREGVSIMLQQAEPEDGVATGRGGGVSLYFVCDEVDALYRELVSRGLQLEPPSIAYYGMKQIFVPEPDGYTICFESPTAEWAG